MRQVIFMLGTALHLILLTSCNGEVSERAAIGGVAAQLQKESKPTTAVITDMESRTSRTEILLTQLKDVSSSKVFVVSHRGDWHSAPENSLAAIQRCIEMGVDLLEIDIRTTRDGKYVLMHDKDLDRMTDGTGKVSHYSLEELRKLRLRDHSGKLTEERICTLQEALETSRGKILVYLDKCEHDIPNVFRIVDEMNMADQVFFYGHRRYEELAKHLGQDFGRIKYLPKLGEGTINPDDYVDNFLKQFHPVAFVTSFERDDSEVLKQFDRIRSGGSRIWLSPLWDTMCGGRTDELALTDPVANWGWLVDHGATLICTDRPGELIAYLRSRKLHE